MTHTIIFFLNIILIIFGYLEYYRHNLKLSKIPVRLLVNGSRGKSTVTRLIAAVLDEAGYSVTARVTGTNAMHLLDDGTEVPIQRKSYARIIEIIDTIKIAEKRNSDVIVIECMAILPEYQKLLSSVLIKPIFTIITNIRADHLDVMGPTLIDVAKSYASTIYKQGTVITADHEYSNVIKAAAEKNNAQIINTFNDLNNEDSKYINCLPGIRENLEIVFMLGKKMGISKEVISAGIKNASHETERTEYILPVGNIKFKALNFFSANDTESTEKLMINNNIEDEPIILIYNHREDRVERGLQFCEFFNKCVKSYKIEGIVFLGNGTFPFSRKLHKAGWLKRRILRIKRLKNIEDLMLKILFHYDIATDPSLKYSATLIGVGNFSGFGSDIVNYWNINGIQHD